jgi:hypothetical protein
MKNSQQITFLKNPVTIVGLPLMVLTIHAVALLSGVYEAVYFFDSIMHFAGGFFSALSLIGILAYARDQGWLSIDDKLVFRLLVLGLIGLVAIAWEVFELLIDAEFGTRWQPSIEDTLKDQVLGVFGAGVAVFTLRI